MAGKPTHGESYSPEYRAWQTARLRCIDANNAAWPDYGGRGITMCERWLNSVEVFIEDMGRKPSLSHELDRRENDRGYEPGNCRWVLRPTNCRNRRSNHHITVGNVTLTIAGWAERAGVSHSTITKRLAAGWTPERAVTTPVGPSGPKMKACVGAIMADVVIPRQRNQAVKREAA